MGVLASDSHYAVDVSPEVSHLYLDLPALLGHARSSCLSPMFNASISALFIIAESIFFASSTCWYADIPAVVRRVIFVFSSEFFFVAVMENRSSTSPA